MDRWKLSAWAICHQIQNKLADEQKHPQDVGQALFSCLQLQDNEPESELTQLFKV
jgi:hypothetical protein